jgi:hypothetical protein
MNLFGFVSTRSRVYLLLNVIGAGISCYASVLIEYMPFIVLEAIWCLVGMAGLFKKRPA